MTRRLLIAEDDRDIASVYTELLVSEGYQVATVYDGQQALDHVKSHRVDLIVSDIRMPRMDGLTMTAKIRELGKTTPIILISAIEFRDKALRFPRVAFLKKPVSIDMLLETIEVSLNGARQTLRKSS